MAPDPEPATSDPEPTAPEVAPDKDSLRGVVEEIVHEVLDGLDDLADADDPPATAEPTTDKGIQEAVRAAVTEAMGPLRDDIAKRTKATTTKPKAEKPEPETPPESPPNKWQKFKEKAWS